MYDVGGPIAGGVLPAVALAVTGGVDALFATLIGVTLAVVGLLALRANTLRHRRAE